MSTKLRPPDYLADSPGTTVVMLGNQAIARGALEAGLHFATAYPGTPSTEILLSLIPAADLYGVRVEWAVNEKVGFEAAVAASLLGLRAMVSMKHVGVNWISDPLLAVNLSGIRGSLVVVVADDPGARSSHNEQDTRYWGFLAELPILEPVDPAEARDMVAEAFELSERLGLPVIVRSQVRVSHARQPVVLGPLSRVEARPCFERHERLLVTGAGGRALRLHAELHRRQEELLRVSESCRFNRLQVPQGAEVAVVTSGVGYGYLQEVLAGARQPVRVLKVGMPFPAPAGTIREVVDGVRAVLVVEEGEPVLELQVRAILQQAGIGLPVRGRHTGHMPPVGELDAEAVGRALQAALGLELDTPELPAGEAALPPLPRRDLTMCAGCPHRATFYALKRVVERVGRHRCIMCGDIGCYSFGSQPPFELVDVKYTMGASVGLASGFSTAGVSDRVFAVIGDSTFLHAGIAALINAAYNGARAVVLVVDNGTVAMTGQQPHPGTGVRATGERAKPVVLEELARAAGAGLVWVVDAYDIEAVEKVLTEAVEFDGLAVVIARRACALEAMRELARQGRRPQPYRVDEDLCTSCQACITELACPALGWDGNVASIIAAECTGCGVCTQVCPAGAITKGG